MHDILLHTWCNYLCTIALILLKQIHNAEEKKKQEKTSINEYNAGKRARKARTNKLIQNGKTNESLRWRDVCLKTAYLKDRTDKVELWLTEHWSPIHTKNILSTIFLKFLKLKPDYLNEIELRWQNYWFRPKRKVFLMHEKSSSALNNLCVLLSF